LMLGVVVGKDAVTVTAGPPGGFNVKVTALTPMVGTVAVTPGGVMTNLLMTVPVELYPRLRITGILPALVLISRANSSRLTTPPVGVGAMNIRVKLPVTGVPLTVPL
jgi:hypothetical protein